MLSVVVFAGCDSLRLMRYIGSYAGTLKVKPVGSPVAMDGTWQFTVSKGGNLTGKCAVKGSTTVYTITGTVRSDGSFSGSWEMTIGTVPVKILFAGTIAGEVVTGEIKMAEMKIGTLEGKKVSILEELMP